MVSPVQRNNKAFSSVFFIDPLNGWVVGLSGKILNTTDGGTTWDAQSSGTSKYLRSVCFIDLSNGWAVGIGGTILHTDNGGMTGFIEPQSIINKLKYKIYPNPFSSATTLEYTLEKASTVTIQIFNNQGQLVEKIIRQPQPKGQHQIQWNAEGLPAGIYYFRIQAGEQVSLPGHSNGWTGSGKMVKME